VANVPETHYARSADGTNLAYQVTGRGPLDLVFLSDPAVPIDVLWEDPGFLRLSERLGAFSRTVWFETRGWGASEGDPLYGVDLEGVFITDLGSVLDAVGLERAALVGWGVSGRRAIPFCVAHPERVRALVVINCQACALRDDDYPWGVAPEEVDAVVGLVRETRGTGASVETLAPSRARDQRFRAWWARCERLAGGPDRAAAAFRATLEFDLRPLLPSIAVPTLLLHRERNRMVSVDEGRYLADHIADAKLVVLPGSDYLVFVGDVDAMVDEIEEFLTGVRGEGEVVLATVLFTDIVASTEHQARIGPREWSRLTDQHDAMVRAALARHRGREIKSIGDGFLAAFDATGRALRCADEILTGAEGLGLELRVGVHSGEVEVRGDDLGGLTVSIAKRICDLAEPDQVLVSEAVRSHVVGSGLNFEDRGEHALKGLPGTWRLYAVSP